MNYELYGWGFDELKRFDDSFEEKTENFYASKELFFHDDFDLSFHYRYCVEVSESEDDKCFIGLFVVPTFESLHKSIKESIFESFGISSAEKIEEYDILSEGNAICIGSDIVEVNEAIVNHHLDKIASVFQLVDRMRGLYFDHPLNLIGTTGWDMIRHFKKGDDLFAPALKRAEKSMKTMAV